MLLGRFVTFVSCFQSHPNFFHWRAKTETWWLTTTKYCVVFWRYWDNLSKSCHVLFFFFFFNYLSLSSLRSYIFNGAICKKSRFLSLIPSSFGMAAHPSYNPRASLFDKLRMRLNKQNFLKTHFYMYFPLETSGGQNQPTGSPTLGCAGLVIRMASIFSWNSCLES